MREPTSGGRNLSRVESIEMLFGEEHEDLLNDDLDIGQLDLLSDVWTEKSQASQHVSLTRQLSRCLSEQEVFDALGMERTNSSSLLLSRCVSSDFMIPTESQSALPSTDRTHKSSLKANSKPLLHDFHTYT